MKIIISILLILATAPWCTVKGISSPKTEGEFSVSLKIHQKDSSKDGTKQSLTLSFAALLSVSHVSLNTFDTTFNDRLDNRLINIKLPAAQMAMRIDFSINGKKGKAYAGVFRNYQINAGDTLEVELFKDSLLFFGPGSEKLNLQTRLFELGRPVNSKLSIKDSSYFDDRNKYFELALSGQLALIEKNKSRLDKEFYLYLRNQCVGYSHYAALKVISGAFIVDPKFGERAAEYYKKHPLTAEIPKDENLDKASYYIDFLFLKEQLDHEVPNVIHGLNRTGAPVILNRLASKYSGKVRERLLVVGFLMLSKYYLDANIYFSQHKELISRNSPYFPYYQRIIDAYGKGARAYNFALQDSTGKIVKLEDFKGKTIVLDFWFTGCQACIALKKGMEPVHQALKNNANLVFMTICVDNDKAIWKKSIQGQKYTQRGSIDLIAPGRKNPVLKFYNITAYPQMMLIDKNGRVSAEKLPFPLDEESRQELLKIIQEVL